MRLSLALALMLLAACAPKLEVASEPVVIEAAPTGAAALDGKRCIPGDDDGIGGTGCQVD